MRTTIQWYPGHMDKALKNVRAKLQMVDLVIELVDARLPVSSRNPVLNDIITTKPRLMVLNKMDLADDSYTKQWLKWFQNQNVEAVAIDSQSGKGTNTIPCIARRVTESVFLKREKKGMDTRAIRCMIVGIPNVGKSSLINRLAKRQATRVGNKPGITRTEQWIRFGKQMELLDTPGVLWPRFASQIVGLRLAASGAIKEQLFAVDDVALFVIQFLATRYPGRLTKRYSIEERDASDTDAAIEILEQIGKRRGCLRRGGLMDWDKVSRLVLHEFQTGLLGTITLERIDDFAESEEALR